MRRDSQRIRHITALHIQTLRRAVVMVQTDAYSYDKRALKDQTLCLVHQLCTDRPASKRGQHIEVLNLGDAGVSERWIFRKPADRDIAGDNVIPSRDEDKASASHLFFKVLLILLN
jgi:hypothetical protein